MKISGLSDAFDFAGRSKVVLNFRDRFS